MRRKRTSKGHAKPRALNRSDGKLKRWNKRSDVPLDDEDQFHASRDEILLEGGDLTDDQDGDDDEVFGLQGMSEDEEDEEDEDENLSDDDEYDEDGMDVDGPISKPTAKKKAKGKTTARSSSSDSESQEEEETWGRSKSAYYSSNAADLESDDEEGNELEVQEAKRLQAKTREALTDNDFGLEDPVDALEDKDEIVDTIDALVPPSHVPPPDTKSLIWDLKENETESQAMQRDWEDTSQSLSKCREKIINEKDNAPNLGLLRLHYQALLTYATTLASYMHLSTSDEYAQQPELLRAHPVYPRLLALKKSLPTLDDDNTEEENADVENEEAQDDAGLRHEDEIPKDNRVRRAKDSEREQPPKKKRKVTTKSEKPSLPVFDLVEPVFASSKPSRRSLPADSAALTDPYGEATSLQHADAVDKSARRKTLRFHTSKIESASAKRQGARTNAVGGDDDLPYRERRKEKEKRMAKEARGQGGEDLMEVDPEIGDVGEENSGMDDDGDDDDQGGSDDDEDDPEGYYNLVKRQAKERKQKKNAEYEAAHSVRYDMGDEDTTGPRAITRTILANKGLTPRRAKAVRNPRVKKRQKFEKAKKKIASQKAIYKGGVMGKYTGEKTGISKVVKSVRFG